MKEISPRTIDIVSQGTDTMSRFSFLSAEQKLLLHVIVVLKVLGSKSSVLIDAPFNSSKTTCRISPTSCWELKSIGALRVDEILQLSAPRKFAGSIVTADFYLIAILSEIDFSNGNSCEDSTEVLQIKGITLTVCRMVFT